MNTKQTDPKSLYVMNPVDKKIHLFSNEKGLNIYVSTDPHKFSENESLKRKQINSKQVLKLQQSKDDQYQILPYNNKFTEISQISTNKINDNIKNKSYTQFKPNNDQNTLGVVVEFENQKLANEFMKKSSIANKSKQLDLGNQIDKDKVILSYKHNNILKAKEGRTTTLVENTSLMINMTFKNWNSLNPNYNSFIVIASKEGEKIKSPAVLKLRKKSQAFALAKKIETESKNQNSNVTAFVTTAFHPIVISNINNQLAIDIKNISQEQVKTQILHQESMREIRKEDEILRANKQKQEQSQKTPTIKKPKQSQTIKR